MVNKSESIRNLATSLAKFHAAMGKIAKDETNPFFKSKYAPLPEVLSAIKEPLANAGLVFTQFPSGLNQLTTFLVDTASGEYMEATYEMTPAKNDPQGQGSVITYQRRYALGAILGLNIDEDDDGNKASTGSAHGIEGVTPWQTPIKSNPALKDLSRRETLIVAVNNVIKDPQDSARVQTTIDKINANEDLTQEDKDLLIPQLTTILEEMAAGTFTRLKKGTAKI